jgi:hypothetical protein
MPHPSGAGYRHTPKWLEGLKNAEDGDGNLMHNPALPEPDAPPNPVAPPSDCLSEGQRSRLED